MNMKRFLVTGTVAALSVSILSSCAIPLKKVDEDRALRVEYVDAYQKGNAKILAQFTTPKLSDDELLIPFEVTTPSREELTVVTKDSRKFVVSDFARMKAGTFMDGEAKVEDTVLEPNRTYLSLDGKQTVSLISKNNLFVPVESKRINVRSAGEQTDVAQQTTLANPELTPETQAAIKEAYAATGGKAVLPDELTYTDLTETVGSGKPVISLNVNDYSLPPFSFTPETGWVVDSNSPSR
jgi:hypothetical protein